MENENFLLKFLYESTSKFDYFILGIDIAILGWTVVNTDWIPHQVIFVWLIGIFWLLIALSIVSGIIEQLYNHKLFGINYQYLRAGKMADSIEIKSIDGTARFIDQKTGEVKTAEEFKKYAEPHRENEIKGKKLYEELNKRSAFWGNTSIVLLVISLFLLAGIKMLILSV